MQTLPCKSLFLETGNFSMKIHKEMKDRNVIQYSKCCFSHFNDFPFQKNACKNGDKYYSKNFYRSQ